MVCGVRTIDGYHHYSHSASIFHAGGQELALDSSCVLVWFLPLDSFPYANPITECIGCFLCSTRTDKVTKQLARENRLAGRNDSVDWGQWGALCW